MGKTKKHAQGSTKKARKDVEEEAEIKVGLGDFSFGGIFKGIGNLIDIVSQMEEEGKTEHRKERIVRGKTASGKEMRGVYGFSVRTGLSGKGRPRIEPFGNIKKTKKGPVVEEVREPLVDVFEEKEQVVVVAELPGIAEKDIDFKLEERGLTIEAVEAGKKKYSKNIELPCLVKSKPAGRSYKNGILELKFNRVKKK